MSRKKNHVGPENPGPGPLLPTVEAVDNPFPVATPKQAVVLLNLEIWPIHEVRSRLQAAFGGHGVMVLDDVVSQALLEPEGLPEHKASEQDPAPAL